MDISIIICFYNAGDKLTPTLSHIGNLQTNGIETELILVNNASTDNSEKIIAENSNFKNHIPWKIVHESKPGLANARLKGLHEATGKYLLFCDDDNWLEKDYLAKSFGQMENDSKIAVLGGNGYPVSDIPVPDWFKDEENRYAVGPQFPQSGEVKGSRNMVYGAGMIVRKSAFKAILDSGFMFLSLGRTGKSLSSGEDSEMCLAFRISGYKIWYDADLRFAHYIAPDRLSLGYLNKLKVGMSNSGFISRFYRDYLLKRYRPKVNQLFWFREVLSLLRQILSDLTKGSGLNDSIVKRNWRLIRFILASPLDYNTKVRWVLKTCDQLDSLKND